jgi:hypothetical protein
LFTKNPFLYLLNNHADSVTYIHCHWPFIRAVIFMHSISNMSGNTEIIFQKSHHSECLQVKEVFTFWQTTQGQIWWEQWMFQRWHFFFGQKSLYREGRTIKMQNLSNEDLRYRYFSKLEYRMLGDYPGRLNSSKEQISVPFTFDHDIRAFLRFVLWRHVHWGFWNFVSGSYRKTQVSLPATNFF